MLGVLLSRDGDHHFSAFELSVYTAVCRNLFHLITSDDAAMTHLFRSDLLPEDDCFAFGARRAESLPFNLPKWEAIRSLMKWHYKHEPLMHVIRRN